MVAGARSYRNFGPVMVLLAVDVSCGTPPH